MVLTDKSRESLVSLFLRWGLALVFLYASISAFINPSAWVIFIPKFVTGIIPELIFLKIHSLVEIFLALWLLSNKKIFYASVISSLALLGIIIFNLTQLDIVFRDIAILFMAIALTILSYKKEK